MCNCLITQSFSFRRFGISLQLISVYSCKYICRFPRGSLRYISLHREHVFVCWTVALPVYTEACSLLMFPAGHESWSSPSGPPFLLRLLAVKWPWCVLVCLCGFRSAESAGSVLRWLFHFTLRASDQMRGGFFLHDGKSCAFTKQHYILLRNGHLGRYCCDEWVCFTHELMFCTVFCASAVAKSPCSPPERRISRSTQSCSSFSITPFTTSKENLPVLNTRIICPGTTTWHCPMWQLTRKLRPC